MAKLTLTIGELTAEIEVSNVVATDICGRAWYAFHAKDTKATKQEKLNWVVNILLRDSLTNASARADRIEEREERMAKMGAKREARRNTRKFE